MIWGVGVEACWGEDCMLPITPALLMKDKHKGG